ncbi:hypothetical protein BRD17_02105 [Halobacteriales archaeon SW_7_68_16]|nr:MAG: hypothetical protein BRD17_02105 [Halobacteriales archaeon SW_7_68_16]
MPANPVPPCEDDRDIGRFAGLQTEPDEAIYVGDRIWDDELLNSFVYYARRPLVDGTRVDIEETSAPVAILENETVADLDRPVTRLAYADLDGYGPHDSMLVRFDGPPGSPPGGEARDDGDGSEPGA